MKKILLCLTYLFLLTFFGKSAFAQDCTYYVSSSTGNDRNSGTSTGTPWETINRVNQQILYPGDTVCFKRGDTWRLPTDSYPDMQSGSPDGYVTYKSYDTGPKPLLLGSVEMNSVSDWTATDVPNVWATPDYSFDSPVGNLIFNNEESTGTMDTMANIDNLDQQGEYFYDTSRRRLIMYSTSNPATYYSDIECALGNHMFYIQGGSYIRISDLDIRYGGAHGIQARGGANNLIFSDNDFSYIGGIIQWGPVRYGNAIEMWESTNNIYVERNRIWEIFDAGLTSQGLDQNQMYNHYFRNNIIWNTTYCFEYWNKPSSSTTNNIYFENNTCVNSGQGFGSGRGGVDLALYENPAQTSNFFIRNNIFYNAVSASLGVSETWNGLSNLVINYNAYYTQWPALIYFEPYGEYTMDEFANYQADTGKDLNSITADPLFVDVASNDFRPVVGSPVCTASSSGSYIGALPCAIADRDNDGMSDDWEIQYGLDPDNPYDAGYDPDGDGRTNLQEYQDGTNPLIYDNKCSSLPVQHVEPGKHEPTYYYYSSLQNAYNSYSWGWIYTQATTFIENLHFDLNKSITILGGYNCDYSGAVGKTVLKGTMSVSNGTLDIRGGQFAIEQ